MVVAANGGSDLIYLPDGDKALAKRIVDFLLTQDYVSGLFVDTKLGKFPGTLSLDDIALEGSAITPHPAIAVNFRSFDTVCGEPVRCTVEDRRYRSCSKARACTARSAAPTPGISWRCRGRTSNRSFVDPAPASNADLGRTIAHLMQLDVHDNGKLVGRVLAETLPNGALPEVSSRVVTSEPAPNGLSPCSTCRRSATTRYFDAAGFPGRTVGLSTAALPSATQ